MPVAAPRKEYHSRGLDDDSNSDSQEDEVLREEEGKEWDEYDDGPGGELEYVDSDESIAKGDDEESIFFGDY